MQEENPANSNISENPQEAVSSEEVKKEKPKKKFLFIKILLGLVLTYLFFDIVIMGLIVPKFLVSITKRDVAEEQEKTVSRLFVYFTEVEGTFYLKYDGRVYPEKDTISEQLLDKHLSCRPSLTEDLFYDLNKDKEIVWNTLVETLSEAREDKPGCVLDFEVSPSRQKFVFSMEWDNPNTGNSYFSANYYTYYFEKEKSITCSYQTNNVCVIYYTTVSPGEINHDGTPYIHSFNDNEEYIALTTRPCSNCGAGIVTSTVLVRFSDQQKKELGETSYFSWRNGAEYEYKELKYLEQGDDGYGDCMLGPCLKDTSEYPVKIEKFNDITSLVGVWQANSIMAAGWHDSYCFFEDGTFHFYPNQMICESQEEEIIGKWVVEDDSLVLSVGSKVLISQTCDEMGFNSNVSKETVTLDTPEEIVLHYEVGGLLEGDNHPSMFLDSVQYWKFSEDPNNY